MTIHLLSPRSPQLRPTSRRPWPTMWELYHVLFGSACYLLMVWLLTGCMVMVDVRHPTGSHYSAAGMVGTDAARVSHPDSWTAENINQSETTAAITRGVLTRSAIRSGTSLLKPITDSTGNLINNIDP